MVLHVYVINKTVNYNGLLQRRLWIGNGAYDRWLLKSQQKKATQIGIALFTFFMIFSVLILVQREPEECLRKRKICPCNLIVPDIIHFYRNHGNISIQESTCLKAAERFHKHVWIHVTDIKSTRQQMKILGLTSPSYVVLPEPYGPGPVHLAILRKYGGIFLKNDIYLLNRLDEMRGHEWSGAGQDDIVAGTQEGVSSGVQYKLRNILLDTNYGALYIKDVIQNCSHSAVRLGVR